LFEIINLHLNNTNVYRTSYPPLRDSNSQEWAEIEKI
jgi:hypothetical protein